MARWTAMVGWMLALVVVGRMAQAQVPLEEAQKRLQQKLSTRPASTQPVSELDRLRDENTRLRVRVAELQSEVSSLRDSARATAGRPTTQPSTGIATTRGGTYAGGPLVGQWRGGDISRGAGYVLEFNPDGSYRRSFLNYPQREGGSYRMLDPQTIEMWTNTAPEDRPHNQYRVTLNGSDLTLTPLVTDGVEVRRPTPLILSRAQ